MRDAALALAIRVASAALVFGLQVLLARLMPGEGYGGFVTLWTWMLALGSFAALGLAESSVRFLPRYQMRQRHDAVQAFWRFGFALVAGVSMVVAVAAMVLTLGFGIEGPLLLVVLVALGLPFLGIEYYLEGICRSFGWFRLAAVPVYILRPLLVGGACLALSAAGVALRLPLVGAVLIGAMALIALGLALVVARRLRALPGAANRAKAGQRRLWLRAALPLLVLSGLDDLAGYADVLVLTLLAEPEAVGVYFAAARSLALAGFVAYAMTLVAGRRFALDLVGQSREVLQQNLLDSTRLTFWATIGAVGVAVLAGPFLLALFGPEFVGGQAVIWILGLGLVVKAMAGQAGELLVVAGRQREALAVSLAVLVVTVAAALVLVPMLGLAGAAGASALGMVARTLGLVWAVGHKEGLRVIALGLPQGVGRG